MPERIFEGQPLDDAGFDGGVPQSLTMGTGAAYNTSTTLIYEAENNFTVELWVKPTATHEIDVESQYGFSGTTGQKFVIDPVHDFGGTGIAGMGISVGTNGVSVYEHADGYMPALLVWESPTPLTAWTHVAVVYENKQPRLYINGVLVRTGLQSTRTQVYPGNLVASGQYGTMEGQADEVRVWSSVRTQQQIEENMHATVATPQSGLAAYWPLKSSDGTTLQDISGNQHHVQLNSSYGSGNWSNDAADLRSYKANGYRYAFNGKEIDTDIGDDNYDYGMRISDSRLGRFLSIDPLTPKYPELTPYQFASNSPIENVDLDGLEPTNSTMVRPAYRPIIQPINQRATVFVPQTTVRITLGAGYNGGLYVTTSNNPLLRPGISTINGGGSSTNNSPNPFRLTSSPNYYTGRYVNGSEDYIDDNGYGNFDVVPSSKTVSEYNTKALKNYLAEPGNLASNILRQNAAAEHLTSVNLPNINASLSLSPSNQPLATNTEQPAPFNSAISQKDPSQLYFVRFRLGPESLKDLQEDAKKAESMIGLHGVSVELKERISGVKDKTENRSALVSDVLKHFKVKQTGKRPTHYTLILPKPLTQSVVDVFNKVFKNPSVQ